VYKRQPSKNSIDSGRRDADLQAENSQVLEFLYISVLGDSPSRKNLL